ncbi:MAG: hypothetical protein ACUVQ1_02455 [Candidatus Kapaibacteriales bacterium]
MVEEFNFPEQITPLGTGTSQQNIPDSLTPNTTQRKIPFRVGEIIRGTVQQIYSPNEALINLPNGAFLAEVNGKFKPGDTLFFQVQMTEPTFVLRIHSVFSKIKDKDIPNFEILRMLNLPSNKIFIEVIENIKKSNSLILRDGVLSLTKNLNFLLTSQPKENLDFLISFLRYIEFYGLAPSIELLQLFKNFIKFPEDSKLVVKYLLDSSQIIPLDLRPQFSKIIQNLSGEIPSTFLFTLFSVNYLRASNNLFDFLFTIYNRTKQSKFPAIFTKILADFVKEYESFIVLSSLSAQLRNGEIFFLAPFILNNNLTFRYYPLQRKRIRKIFEKKKLIVEEEKIFPPIPEDTESKLENFLSDEKQQKFLMHYEQRLRKNVTIVGDKVIVVTPSGEKLTFKLTTPPTDDNPNVSIVI